MEYSDQEIIKSIRKGGKPRNDMAVYLLNKYRGYFEKVASKYNFSNEVKRDTYTECIVKLITQIDQNQFKGQSKLSTYFHPILKNYCIDVFRKESSNKNKPTSILEEWTVVEKNAFEKISSKQYAEYVNYVIEKMDKLCQNVLLDWGYYGYSMQEIAERNNLNGADSARSTKYQCLKKLRSMLDPQEQ